MKEKKAVKFLWVFLIQIIILSIYAAGNYFAMKIEAVVLEPLVYLVPFGVLLLAANLILLVMIMKKTVMVNEKPIETEVNKVEDVNRSTEMSANERVQAERQSANMTAKPNGQFAEGGSKTSSTVSEYDSATGFIRNPQTMNPTSEPTANPKVLYSGNLQTKDVQEPRPKVIFGKNMKSDNTER